jgi:hypothetical protein
MVNMTVRIDPMDLLPEEKKEPLSIAHLANEPNFHTQQLQSKCVGQTEKEHPTSDSCDDLVHYM